VIYHRTIENNETHYKTLWSEEGNSRFFVVSATNDPSIEVNETMVFAADSEGQIISWRPLAESYPASRDQQEHETLASQAYDESAKEVMGISGGRAEERDLRESMGMDLFNHAYALGYIKEND
tara:strand:- start:270 stop:638 length:369 start_codon:yes stop_codon:yes gene_type:complete